MKKLVALISQVGTAIPTMQILENTFLGNFTFHRGGEGVYGLESDNSYEEFTANKTWVIIGQLLDQDINNGTPDLIIRWRVLSPDTVQIFTSRQEDLDTPQVIYNGRDGLLNNTPIEIRVYD